MVAVVAKIAKVRSSQRYSYSADILMFTACLQLTCVFAKHVSAVIRLGVWHLANEVRG